MNDQSHIAFPAVTEGTIGTAVVQTVNARDLHAFLGVGKDFATWMKDRISAYAFNENSDFVLFPEVGENAGRGCPGKEYAFNENNDPVRSPVLASEGQVVDNTSLPKVGERVWGGRNRKEYALSIDMAKELGMIERSEKGKEVRRYFIACERKAKEASRAKAKIDFSDPAILLGTFKHLQNQVAERDAKIAVLQPQADALSKIAVADGSLCITDAAKTLQMRPSDLFKWLQTNDWIYGRIGNSHHVGYQAKIAAGYLEHKVTSVYRSDGTEKVITQVRVTPKGLAKLGALLSPPKPPEAEAPRQGPLFEGRS